MEQEGVLDGRLSPHGDGAMSVELEHGVAMNDLMSTDGRAKT